MHFVLQPTRQPRIVEVRFCGPTLEVGVREVCVTEERTDSELMLAISGGDRDALGELYGRHASTVTALARKFRLGDAAVDDVVHEVFMWVWERASEFDPARGSLVSWLAVRLRSRCIDDIRKQSRRAELLAENADSLRPRTPTPPGTEAVERNRLRQAVAELEDDLREVTQLAYFDGVSTREIAEQLEIAQGTVKSRMRRAREALHVALTTGGA